LERAAKTFLQAVAAGIGTASMFDQVDWNTALSSAAVAAVYSAITSVLSVRLGPADTTGQVDVTSPPTRRVHAAQ
jgi:hypothetical protein